MEQELKNLIKVWISAFISITYCYYFSSKISKGYLRLLSLVPIFIIFLLLPLFLSSVHFCATTSFFLSWLANFKLLLFAFDQEPLSPLPSSLSRFFCFTCFPIKTYNNKTPSSSYNKPKPKWFLALKVMVFSFFLHLYVNNYHTTLPRFAFLAMFSIHVYLEAELILVSFGALLSTLLGCEILPVFNEPYLSTSLQDFWSRRWNLMVPLVLRQTVHIPVQLFTARLIGQNLAYYAGVLATFLVSGLMHELIYFYIIRESPTWEVTCFFVLHGVATSAEIAARRTLGWLQTPTQGAFSVIAVWAFVFITSGYLFCPQVIRNGVHKRVINECLFVVDIAKLQFSRILM